MSSSCQLERRDGEILGSCQSSCCRSPMALKMMLNPRFLGSCYPIPCQPFLLLTPGPSRGRNLRLEQMASEAAPVPRQQELVGSPGHGCGECSAFVTG